MRSSVAVHLGPPLALSLHLLGSCALAPSQQAPSEQAPQQPAEGLTPMRWARVAAADAAARVQWVEDTVALRRHLRELELSREVAAALGDLDFRDAVVLSALRPVPRGEVLAWDSSRRDGADLVVRLTTRAAVAGDGPAPTGGDLAAVERGALFVVPRTDRSVRVEWPDGAGWMTLTTLPHLADPAAVELPAVSAVRELADTAWPQARVARVTSAAEWRELRGALGPAVRAVPDGFADFARECLVVVGTGRARAWPGLSLQTATEEGVDVLTVTETSPSGESVDERAPVLLIKLPRRARQCAVVLRRVCGPGPGTEETLAVLSPLR